MRLSPKYIVSIKKRKKGNGKKSPPFLDEDGLTVDEGKKQDEEHYLGARQGSGLKLEKPS